MEGLLVLLAIFWAIYSGVSKTKKATQSQQKSTGQKQPQQASQRRAPQPGARAPKARQATFATPSAAPSATPSPNLTTLGEGMSGYQVMTHRLEPLDRRTTYTGSLGGASTEGAQSAEGEDACDPSLGHGAGALQTNMSLEPEGATGMRPSVSFTPQSILNGVVMNEILTRPAQKKWGHPYHG